MKFFTNLKRLLEPRTQAPAETIEQPTADRPPPMEGAPSDEPTSVKPTPAVEEVAEIRALLEAVAEPPAVSTKPDVEPPPSAPEITSSAPEPSAPLPQASSEPVPDAASSQAPNPIGDALVLTLATQAATFAVAKASATIGRGQENTIRLDDLSVSRRHARIAYKQGGYWLSDLGSMGGTWVDGTRLNAPRRIAAGEVIDIGLCRLTVSFAGGAPNGKVSPSSQRSELAESRRRR